MKSTVVLRKHQNEHWTRIELDADGHVMESRKLTQLSETPPHQPQQRLIVLLPGAEFLMTQIKIPKMRHSELLQAVPYALEDQLASPVEQLYFSLGHFDETGYLNVVVTDRDSWQAELVQLNAVGLKPNLIIPDYLALPLIDNTWTIAIDVNLAIVRTGVQSGFAVDFENLVSLLQLQLNQASKKPRTLYIYQEGNPFDTGSLAGLDIEVVVSPDELSDHLPVDELIKQPAINLLQGKYRSTAVSSKVKRPWKFSAIAFLVLLFVLFGGRAVELFYLNIKLNHLRQQTTQVYQTIFPGQTTIVEPRFQVNDLLTRLNKAATANRFLHLMVQTGDVLQSQTEIELQSLNYQDGQLTLEIQTNKMSNLENFTRFLVQKGLRVKQNQLTTSKRRVSAKLQVGGAVR